MAPQHTIAVLSTFTMVAMALFGHGSLPLNDADDINAMKPNCISDRYGNKYVACPSPDPDDISNWPCIKISDLCNVRRDCPNGEDETEIYCFYHKFRTQQLQILRRELENAKKV